MSNTKSVLEQDHKAQIEYELKKQGFKKQFQETQEGISIVREGCTIDFPQEYVKKIIEGESSKDKEVDVLIRDWIELNKHKKLDVDRIVKKLSIEYGETGDRLKELFKIVHGRTTFKKMEIGILNAYIPFRYFKKEMKKREYSLNKDKIDYGKTLDDFHNAYDLIKSIDADLVYGNFSERFYEDILAFARSPCLNFPLEKKEIDLIIGVERNGYNNFFKAILEAKGFDLEDSVVKAKLKKICEKDFNEFDEGVFFEKDNTQLTYYFKKGDKGDILKIEGEPKNIGKIFNESLSLLEDV